MAIWRWLMAEPPDDLGAIVHGPALLARGPGIGAGLRHVTAHSDRLVLALVVRARDVWAEAARRQGFAPTSLGPFWDDRAPLVGSEPQLVVGMDDHTGVAHPSGPSSSGGVDEYVLEAEYVIGALPRDGVLRLVLSWPQAGLEETATDLHLSGLDDVADRVVTLLA